MLEMKTVDNFRIFETDENGNELHMTEEVCYVCDQPSEVYVSVQLPNIVALGQIDTDEILFCKTCLGKGEEMWNKAFLVHARRDREQHEEFLRRVNDL
jgi:hypothetical protein